ncbi:zf-TFIIB domain-containing protein [Candidatus Woesearchaeota archaeon]|nr:zf-TFIIB domain-containing protein [Candidatus Woesearchaeota archaeon]
MKQNLKLACPRCSTLIGGKIMRQVKHPSGATLDVCGSCGGMWLDHNEVKLLYDFSKIKGGRKK